MSLPVALHRPTTAAFAGALELLMPETIDCVVGSRALVHVYDSLAKPVAGADPIDGAPYSIVVRGPGRVVGRSWQWTPQAEDVGQKTLAIQVLDESRNVVGLARARLVVRPEECPSPTATTVLVIGDSITEWDHVLSYVNRSSRLLTAAGVPWTYRGEFAAASADAGVRHQGEAGRTWRYYVGLDNQSPTPSPFDDAGSVTAYRTATCASADPTIIHVQLGTNDSASYTGTDSAARASVYADIQTQAETLIARLRVGFPTSAIVVGTAFQCNSLAAATMPIALDRWRLNRHDLVRRILESFDGRRADGIYVAPTHLALDSWDGYGPTDGIHPDTTVGHEQIANAIVSTWRAITT